MKTSILDMINKVCLERGTLLSDIAKHTSVGKSIYSWDKSKPSYDKVQEVASYLGVSTSYLLGESEGYNDDADSGINFICRRYYKSSTEERTRMEDLFKIAFREDFGK